MRKRRTTLLLIVLAGLLGGAAGMLLLAQRRLADCAYVPIIGRELLPNATLAPGDNPKLPQDWFAPASGVELRGPQIGQGEGFEYDNDGRAIQLLGIGNYVQTPPIDVQPDRSYCFAGKALTDSQGSATRLQIQFVWRDRSGATLRRDISDWQPVVLWRQENRPKDWSTIRAAFTAPAGATSLLIRIQPASDDRVYLDAMHARHGGNPVASQQAPVSNVALPTIAPWPNGYTAALSFSWDWETTMGGLIHSRSLASDDLHNAEDPRMRGLRMRQGITTTLELFRQYNIQSTYYATGYNFLDGNTAHHTYMNDPTFTWAATANGWKRDWSRTPWFGSDPYGTIQSDPDYYFADLMQTLQRDRQAIQSHTFSHLYGGYARAAEWRADFGAWHEVAAALGVPAARSLAFPWSSSAGMSDDSWRELEAAGITSVTRTNWSQLAYRLADRDTWRCQAVPGHERILACPDFYLIAGRNTPPDAAITRLHAGGGRDEAIKQIDRAIAQRGMIDIWAHTEEATTPEQIADWQAVIGYAAAQRDAGKLWIAPLAEIADWQQAIAQVRTQTQERAPAGSTDEQGGMLSFVVSNDSQRDLKGLTMFLPFEPKRVALNGDDSGSQFSVLGSRLVVDIRAGETVEVQAWPA
jgi:hypothetical protein